jgi:hypothetical protein
VGQLIGLMAITYFVAEIMILFHLKCPPDVPLRDVDDMSAFGGKADIAIRQRHVCF